MVLGFGSQQQANKADDVAALIAKKNYAKAIELIRAQMKTGRPDPRLRLQLGDLLVLANKPAEAVQILMPLADEFAKDGFAAKAISVFKKIQKIDPSRRDIEGKLASLIQEKQRVATSALPLASPRGGGGGAPDSSGSGGFEIGMEEIGMEMEAPISAPAPRSAPAPEPYRAPEPEPVRARVPEPEPEPFRVPEPEPFGGFEEAPALDLGFDAPVSAPAPVPPPVVATPAPPPPRPTPPPPAPAPVPVPPPPAPVVEARPAPPPPAPPPPRPAPPPPAVIDADFDGFEVDAMEVEAEPIEEGSGLDFMGADFANELLSAVEDAFQDFPGEGGLVGADTELEGGNQIVVSPLFKDLAVDELVAVIHGLNLLTFNPNQIIIREGEPGHSLYILTAGTVRAYKKGADGKHAAIGELQEGAFFGEGAILTGQPRSATIVAVTYCELLELDRPTLDSITQQHPRVWDILQDFARQRGIVRK